MYGPTALLGRKRANVCHMQRAAGANSLQSPMEAIGPLSVLLIVIGTPVSAAPLGGSRADGVLYEASSWHEIDAFLFGTPSDGSPLLPPTSAAKVCRSCPPCA